VTSAEYQAAMKQLFSVARERLDAALADRQWTALASSTDVSNLPTAIILDSDETIFDNVAFEGQMIARGKVYDDAAWKEWITKRAAKAIPGAVEFVHYAQSRGVTPFFITNRTAAQEADTRGNLEKIGVTLSSSEDTVLTKGERPEWSSSDKSSRRESVAATHRVLLLFGDDLNDFVNANGKTPDVRAGLVRDSSERWGRQWFLVPNAMYGSWAKAATGKLDGECAEYQKMIELLAP
jgi:5'-nucleotidase (lipoprotein e(P4) family)